MLCTTADDSALNTTDKAKMQQCLDRVSGACDAYGLTMSTIKTENMFQPAPEEDYNSPEFTVNGQKLSVADKFTYLGSSLSRCVHIDEKVTSRVSKASEEFGRLRNNVWDRQGLSLSTKLKVYRVIVLSVLLYMLVKYGPFINDMPRNWIGFTSHAYANCYGSVGAIWSLTLRSWDALSSLVSKLCSLKPSCACCPHARRTSVQKTAVWWASGRKEICWRST